MWAVGGRPTLPISTDHKCWGAPSFALLRRVGSKALDQLQRRCPCCCLSFLPVLFACHPVEPALSEVEWGSAVVVACPSFRPQKAKALNQPQRRCPCRCPSFLPHPKIVISTEAAHALSERRGGEPPAFRLRLCRCTWIERGFSSASSREASPIRTKSPNPEGAGAFKPLK